MGMRIKFFLKSVWEVRNIFLIIIAFVSPVSFLIDGEKESRCAYVVVAVAILWLTEALPIYVTALLPVFLLPMLRIQSSDIVCRNYVNETSMMYLGGFIVAVGMEEVNLHKRIAVGVACIFGSSANTLLLALTLTTGFLSMWICNAAATCMMIPIVKAIIEEIITVEKDEEEIERDNSDVVIKETRDVNIEISNNKCSDEKREHKKMGEALALCVAYAASIGGNATPTGSSPNIIMLGQADIFYKKYGLDDSGITYGEWMGFNLPLVLILLIVTWVLLGLYFLRNSICTKTDEARKQRFKKALGKEYDNLGNIKYREIVVLILFCAQAMLWITRDLPNIGGWSVAFLDDEGKSTVRSSTAAILVASLLFVIPEKMPHICCWYKEEGRDKEKIMHYKSILTWQTTWKKISSDIIFLMGGGFALADACTSSGLSNSLVCKLQVFSDMEPWVMNLVLCFVVAILTEMMHNGALFTVLAPIIFELAIAVEVHPLYLLMSSCIASSFAFMLPVGTPPNAIAFSAGYLEIKDMVLVGLLIKIIAVLCLILSINTWGSMFFGLNTFPEVFKNSSYISSCVRTVTNTSITNVTSQIRI